MYRRQAARKDFLAEQGSQCKDDNFFILLPISGDGLTGQRILRSR